MGNVTSQVQLVPGTKIDAHQGVQRMAFYDASGNPASVGSQAPVVTTSAVGTVGKATTSPEPAANSIVAVKFNNGNSATSPTLAFNGGTARAMQLGGTAVTAAKLAVASNGIALFFFDGTVLHQVGAYT
jgi:hypothetical protein